jgi:C4-dicarboxylate-specific signal transduction histidine kinase
LLANDRSIRADVFWLRFALANLVQNAFAHGCEPVRIRLSVHNDQVMIAVEDEGVCEFTSIKDMTKPFQKSSSSEGMGLGLNITETIVRDWGGTLSYNASPTSFTITTVCQ